MHKFQNPGNPLLPCFFGTKMWPTNISMNCLPQEQSTIATYIKTFLVEEKKHPSDIMLRNSEIEEISQCVEAADPEPAEDSVDGYPSELCAKQIVDPFTSCHSSPIKKENNPTAFHFRCISLPSIMGGEHLPAALEMPVSATKNVTNHTPVNGLAESSVVQSPLSQSPQRMAAEVAPTLVDVSFGSFVADNCPHNTAVPCGNLVVVSSNSTAVEEADDESAKCTNGVGDDIDICFEEISQNNDIPVEIGHNISSGSSSDDSVTFANDSVSECYSNDSTADVSSDGDDTIIVGSDTPLAERVTLCDSSDDESDSDDSEQSDYSSSGWDEDSDVDMSDGISFGGCGLMLCNLVTVQPVVLLPDPAEDEYAKLLTSANANWRAHADVAWAVVTPTKVRFHETVVINEWDDCGQSRKSPWVEVGVNRMRFERRIEEANATIGWIFAPSHRLKFSTCLQEAAVDV